MINISDLFIKAFKTATKFPLHPFFVSGFYVLISYKALSSRLHFADLIIVIGLSIIIPAAFLLSFRIFKIGNVKAAIIVTFLLFPFYYYLQIVSLVQTISPTLGRDRFVIPLLLIICVLGIVYFIRTKRTLISTQGWLNTTFFFSIVVLFVSLLIQTKPLLGTLDPTILYKSQKFITVPATLQKRDIVYIILDAHASVNSLKRLWNYDEAGFIDSLQKKGFYIAHNSLSFSFLTHKSQTSTFNISNLSKLDSLKADEYFDLINQCVVGNFLAANGYKIINLSFLKIHNEDKFYKMQLWEEDFHNGVMGFFRNTLPFAIIQRLCVITFPQIHSSIISKLKAVRREQRTTPLFIYAHISAPHFPYVFNHNGNILPWIKRKQYEDKNAYLENLRGIDNLILPAIDSLLAGQGPKPIIVLQGDHGSRLFNKTPERMESFSMLNAYYLPDVDTKVLNEHLSPYNTFRIIFNLYFGQHLPLLEDGVHY
jgi:hypothetical protein